MLDHKEDLELITDLETMINIREAEIVSLGSQIMKYQDQIGLQNEELIHITEINEVRGYS